VSTEETGEGEVVIGEVDGEVAMGEGLGEVDGAEVGEAQEQSAKRAPAPRAKRTNPALIMASFAVVLRADVRVSVSPVAQRRAQRPNSKRPPE
jgi:hypothetical protein